MSINDATEWLYSANRFLYIDPIFAYNAMIYVACKFEEISSHLVKEIITPGEPRV